MKPIRLALLGALCLAMATAVWAAQDTPVQKKKADARQKLNARPGEVNTPPARGERHADRLKVGDPAPDFTLADPAGKQQTRLSSFQGNKPVVLIFGSFS
jgi:hypothetical protein